MTSFGPQIMLCPPEARSAALEVLYRRVPEGLRDRLIDEVLDEATRGDIDLSGLWIVRAKPARSSVPFNSTLGRKGSGGLGS